MGDRQASIHWIRRIIVWLILLVAIAIGMAPLIPPRPAENPSSTAFSVENAMAHIEDIAVEPRPMGSEGNQRGRAKIVAALWTLGIEPELQSFTVPNYFSRAGEPVELVNVLARIPGTDSQFAVAVMGHHDTFPITLGANDNAHAIAIMLESARVIQAGPPLQNDVIFLFTDGEEPAPRYGASTFARTHPWFDEIGVVINLEAIGTGGPSLVVGMSGSRQWLIREYARSVPHPAAFSFITTIAELMGGSNTDLSVFKEAGVTGLDFAYVTGSPIYHTIADSPDSVGVRTLHQQGANTLALLRRLGSLDQVPSSDDASESVFLTLGRGVVARYPESWSLPLAVLAGVVLLVGVLRQRGWTMAFRSLLSTFGSAVISMAVCAGLWILVGGWRNSMGVVESYLYLACIVVITLTIGWGMARITRRRIGEGSDGLGTGAFWWVLAMPLAILAPGVSYLFVWPTLVAGTTLLWRPSQAGMTAWQLVRWAVVSIVTLIVTMPAIDFFYQFAQPRPGNLGSQVLVAVVVPILLLSLTIELLRVFRPRVQA